MKQHHRTLIFNTTVFSTIISGAIFFVLLVVHVGCTRADQLPLIQAKIVNPVADIIAPQHHINTNYFYARRDAQPYSKQLLNLAHERASWARRAKFAHDKNLRDFFRNCPVHLLAHIFNYHLQNGDLSEPGILSLYGLYTNPALLAYITTLPGYVQHIDNLHSQAHHCQTCKERVTKQMRFNDPNAVMRFLDDAQQKINIARVQQAHRAQVARQQETLQQQQQKDFTENKKPSTQRSISKKYEIRYTTQELIEKHGISAREFTEFEGDQQQHALHGEFIDIINSAADLELALKSAPHKSNNKHATQRPTKQSYRSANKQALAFLKQNKSHANNYKIKSCFINSCKTLIIKSADLGIQSNKKGDTAYARKIADFCYVALGCAQDVALDIAIGTAEGVCQGVKNVGTMVIHPIDTGLNIAHATHTIVACAYSTIVAAGSGEISVDFDQTYNLARDFVIKKASQATVRDVVRGVAEIATETILTGKLCGVIAEFIESTQIISRASRGAKRAARAVKALNKEKPIGVTSEGIEVYLVEGANGSRNAVRVLSAESKAGNVAKRANILKSEMDSASGAGHAVGSAQGAAGKIGELVSAESRTLIENTHKQLMLRLEPEIARLRLIFDGKVKGFNEFVNKYIKIDYKHILGIDLSFTKRGMPQIGGFHHDFMHCIEKCGLFEFANKVIHPSGFYSAEVRYLGHKVKEITFFPADWSHEEVIGKIYEAYNNFIKSGAAPRFEKNQKYFISGVTNDGIEIHMFLTQKGVMTSAYPILK